MIVTVRFFAVVRERAGVASFSLGLAEGATVSTAVEKLSVEVPAIAPDLRSAGYAVNREYVPKQTILHDGDELAVIPPVSGG